jgi:hypothetical protein
MKKGPLSINGFFPKINEFKTIKKMQHLFFYLAISLIVMHEMDAIRCKEWRIFPLLSMLNDDVGFKVFMVAHIPLFTFIFIGLNQTNNEQFIQGLDVFFIVHLGLHLLFLFHKENEFKDWMSWSIIVGAALFGLLDLIGIRFYL